MDCSAMKEGANGKKDLHPPEFLSTHPSHDRRISQFDEWMPDAMKTFESTDSWGDARCRSVRQEMKKARQVAAARHAEQQQFDRRI